MQNEMKNRRETRKYIRKDKKNKKNKKNQEIKRETKGKISNSNIHSIIIFKNSTQQSLFLDRQIKSHNKL